MPDTVIMDTLKEFLEEGECSFMNAKDFKDWLERVEKKIDNQVATQFSHVERIAKLEEKATAAHRRIDEAFTGLKGPGKPAWLAIVLAIIAAVASMGVAAVSARTSAKTEEKIDALKK
jgi:hypothetical protein